MQLAANYFNDIPPKLINNNLINNIITKYDKAEKEIPINKITNKIYKFIENYFSYILFFLLLIIFLCYRYHITQKKKMLATN
jgi:hypothetical protein